jgi:hypothetical protein
MTAEIESPVVSTFGMGASPWIAGAFYSGLAMLQLGTGVAYAADKSVPVEPGGAFKVDVIAVTAIASSVVTLFLGLAHAYSAFLSRKSRDEIEREERRFKAQMELRWKAVEARLVLLKNGLRCEEPKCPIVATVKGEVDFDAIPFGKPVKDAKNDDKTVDIP